MSCVHWSSEEKSVFESTLKAWAVKKQFRLDKNGWPRIKDWEGLKAAIFSARENHTTGESCI